MDFSIRLLFSRVATFLWVIAGFLSFALLAMVVWVGTSQAPTYEDERAAARIKRLEELRNGDRAVLETLGYVDKAKNITHVPIREGMVMAMNALRNKPVQASSVVVPAPVSIAVPASAPQESPAPASNASSTPVEAAVQPTTTPSNP